MGVLGEFSGAISKKSDNLALTKPNAAENPGLYPSGRRTLRFHGISRHRHVLATASATGMHPARIPAISAA
jgi:hypothetical protein